MTEKVTVVFENKETGLAMELEIPTNISANDLVLALNNIYELDMDTENIFDCYLVSENPIAFLRGNKLIADFGIHNGSKIIYKRG